MLPLISSRLLLFAPRVFLAIKCNKGGSLNEAKKRGHQPRDHSKKVTRSRKIMRELLGKL